LILTSNDIKNTLQDYSNKNTKISREAKSGKLIKLKNGLYETNPNAKGYLLAGSIYSPSYLSFEFALQYHGLIPTKTTIYTSATCNKKRKKIFENKFGTYLYRDIPERVFSLGINDVDEGGYKIRIATPEKALCDILYTLSPLKNMRELCHVLLEDFEIDMESLLEFNIEPLQEITKEYHSANVMLFYRYMKK
jgi:predicted transcriptional regulator of viral defense system